MSINIKQAVGTHACSNNRKKIFLWKKSMCARSDTRSMSMYYSIQTTCNTIQGIYTIRALNRKELPKKVFVCFEHFINGKPTDRNPYPKLKLGYDIRATPGRRKILRQNSAV